MDVIAGIHAHAHDNSTCCVPGVLLTHPLLGAQCSDLIRGVSVSGGDWHGARWGRILEGVQILRGRSWDGVQIRRVLDLTPPQIRSGRILGRLILR